MARHPSLQTNKLTTRSFGLQYGNEDRHPCLYVVVVSAVVSASNDAVEVSTVSVIVGLAEMGSAVGCALEVAAVGLVIPAEYIDDIDSVSVASSELPILSICADPSCFPFSQLSFLPFFSRLKAIVTTPIMHTSTTTPTTRRTLQSEDAR
jgi:hypothetical protein